MGPGRVTLSSGEVRWEIRYNDAGRGRPTDVGASIARRTPQTFLDERCALALDELVDPVLYVHKEASLPARPAGSGRRPERP